MRRFMLILSNGPRAYEHLSPEELQQVYEKYRAWSDKLRATDRLANSDKLKEEGGKVLTAQRGRLSVVDGPYSETKEVVGGYMMLRAESYDEAVAIASDCPHLDFGTIVIRQTDPMGCGGE